MSKSAKPAKPTSGILFIGCVHAFDGAARAVLDRVRPDARLTDPVKVADSIAQRRAAIQNDSILPPLRQVTHAVVLDRENKLFEHSGDDAGVQLMEFLSDFRPDNVDNYHLRPAGLIGFNVEENLTIAAFNAASSGRIPPYWAWNCDHRVPNWFLDPYKYLCSTKEARDLVPVRDMLDRVGFPVESEHTSALGSAVAARHLAHALGLC